jgi:putative transposase
MGGSDDLLKRDFTSAEPLEKCVTDITEIKSKDEKLYVSAIFDCFDAAMTMPAVRACGRG